MHSPTSSTPRLIALFNSITLFVLMLGLSLVFLTPEADAASRHRKSRPSSTAQKSITDVHTVDGIHVVGTKATSADVASIRKTVTELMTASNNHDLEKVLAHYSARFVSGDNLTLGNIQKLIEETWATFPDIKYQTKTMEIRINGDWATVESVDTARATTKNDPVIHDKPGTLISRSRGLLYLHRMGKTWEIMSDYTLYEMAKIQYGELGELDIDLSTPEQVFAGESYSAEINVNVPTDTLAIATITQEPLVYPQEKPRDRFRSLSNDKESLERIFYANKTNNNEIVTATIGLTQIRHDQERPSIALNGIATIVKRVNVIPKTTYHNPTTTPRIIKRSASGKVDLNEDPLDEDDESTIQAAPKR